VTAPTTLVIERILDAPPERVFAVWTTGEAMTHWYRDSEDFTVTVRELDVRVGGRYRVEFGATGQPPYVEYGEYLEVDPPHRLVMTETLEGVPAPWAGTLVTVELHETGDGDKTRLVLTHERFPTEQHRDLAADGWPGFIDRIETLATP